MSDVDTTKEADAITAAHPLNTGRHDLYGQALRLVGARHAKGELVEMVNWLLAERDALRAERDRWHAAAYEEHHIGMITEIEHAAALATARREGAEAMRETCAADTDCGCKERDEVLRRNAINSTHAEMACPVGNMCQALQAAEIRALPLPESKA